MVYCDNATNIRRVAKDMKVLWPQIMRIRDRLPDGIEWRFSNPRAPYENGFFERLIQAVKKAMARVWTNGTMSDDEFGTVLATVEGMVNARPLALISSDPRDESVVTPGHFLMGREWEPLVFSDPGGSLSAKRRWLEVQKSLDHFWRAMVREVTPYMNQIPKWRSPKDNVHKDDIVLVLEERSRGLWPLARVVDVFPGRDQIVRSVQIRLGKRLFRRSVRNLLPIVRVTDSETPNASGAEDEDQAI